MGRCRQEVRRVVSLTFEDRRLCLWCFVVIGLASSFLDVRYEVNSVCWVELCSACDRIVLEEWAEVLAGSDFWVQVVLGLKNDQ